MILDKVLYDKRNPLSSLLKIIRLFFADLLIVFRKKKMAPDILLASQLRGIPVKVKKGGCSDCDLCVQVCPTNALEINSKKLLLNVERCIYCEDCITFCPDDSLKSSKINVFSSHGENKNFLIDLEKEGELVFGKGQTVEA